MDEASVRHIESRSSSLELESSLIVLIEHILKRLAKILNAKAFSGTALNTLPIKISYETRQ